MKRYGLFGKELSYSFSANYFSEKFSTENVTVAEYLNFEIDTIETFTELLAQNKNLSGLNVTIPYKESVIPYLDEIDSVAKQ